MERHKNIMIVYNRQAGDEAGLQRAMNLARVNGAHLTLAETATAIGTAIHCGSDEQLTHLRRFTSGLRHEGISASAVVLRGEPVFEVVRHVIEAGIDLLFVSKDGANGWRNLTKGRFARSLVRECPCPVWVMQPESGPRFSRILAAVGLGESGQARALDLKVLELASSLARAESCRLDIMHVWDFIGGERDTSRSEITPEILQALKDRNISRHKSSLNRLMKSLDLNGITTSLHFPCGIPFEEIGRFLDQNSVDLVVLGERVQSGLWAGATAEDVLAMTDCQVLTVKPDAFVSSTEHALDGIFSGRRPPTAAS